MKKNRKPTYAITVALIMVAAIVSYFIIYSWQNNVDVIAFDPIQATIEDNNHPPTANRTPLATGDPDMITIPDRSIVTPVIYVDAATEEVFQEALTNGVVHYPGTALPGEPGNPYIFGHSSDYFWKPGNYKEVFKALVDIPLDTEIHITNSQGELFVYRVIETKIVGPKEVSVLDQFDYERTMLTLQTSYPIGTALKRYIVVAELDDAATYGPRTGN